MFDFEETEPREWEPFAPFIELTFGVGEGGARPKIAGLAAHLIVRKTVGARQLRDRDLVDGLDILRLAGRERENRKHSREPTHPKASEQIASQASSSALTMGSPWKASAARPRCRSLPTAQLRSASTSDSSEVSRASASTRNPARSIARLVILPIEKSGMPWSRSSPTIARRFRKV